MEKTKQVTTLVIIHNHPRVLLGMKKRGFGAGRWNGFGGKVMPDETIEQSARRELMEEAGIEARALTKLGVMEFEFDHNTDWIEVHLFKANEYHGRPKESEEMLPRWFSMDEIPFMEMWPDDRYWFPFFMRNKKFKGRFQFGHADSILNYQINEVEEL
ncbi:MAG: 8-oxo-dGTP diphosphatase [Candidatus Taylorbacteria bacterium]|nr:8-oxo-dGTP diphosphatase [Candidatus Taylorbacteria bacterium]